MKKLCKKRKTLPCQMTFGSPEIERGTSGKRDGLCGRRKRETKRKKLALREAGKEKDARDALEEAAEMARLEEEEAGSRQRIHESAGRAATTMQLSGVEREKGEEGEEEGRMVWRGEEEEEEQPQH